MAFSIGDHLGRFEILGALGSGGMGDVYRARDPQLHRDVAIKVLPPESSGDPARQNRLEQEARAAASLNHPNVVAVHDFGIQEDRAFIVTELLQGETLRQRIGNGLPPHKAVEYAIHIASGLAAGHDRGIIHRDIKPENIFVTTDGVVKILDFGLATLVDPDALRSDSATVTSNSVALGPTAGTAVYMAPEQARGLRVDHRADIFSLGSVLYEMLTGAAPFRRETVADTLSAILTEEPPELSPRIKAPPALERIVRHCLEKRPGDRFQHARDLIFDLQAALQLTPAVADPPASRTTTWYVAAAAGLALAAATALIGYVAGTRSSGAVPDATAMHGTRRLTEFPGLEEFPAISPDGRSVAFAANNNGRRQIFVRLLAAGPPLAITKDAADHQYPRWTPDGNSVVYSATVEGEEQATIWSTPALGGAARRLMPCLSGVDISASGRLACFRQSSDTIQLVSTAADGSDVRVVIPASRGYHRFPRWSPDGRWIAFQSGDGVRDDVFVVGAEGGEPRRLTNERNVINGLTWLPKSDGIVYASSRGNTVPYLPALRLWEVPLSGGMPRPLTAADTSYEQPDIHGGGIASAARLQMRFDIWRFPVDGEASENVRRGEQITRQTGQVLTPTPAPNGQDIAFLADHGGRANLWIVSGTSGELRQITFENDPEAAVGAPVWSPDGRSIAFVSSKGRKGLEFGVWLVNADGSGLRNIARQGLGMAWSPDGQWIYYSDTSAGALKKIALAENREITVRQEPTRNVIGIHDSTLYYMVERPLVDGRFEHEVRAATPEDGPSRLVARIPAARVASWQIINPSLSPDGEWLALPLTDGITTNIWALSTRTGQLRQVTDFGDRAIFIARRVSWMPDGKSIVASIGEGDADIVLLDLAR